ncbi:MAG: sigma-70 family RNA polymerase sigma factor [Planctomycetota bacterium]
MNGPETRESLLASLNDPAADEGWRDFSAIYRPLIFRVAVAKGLQHADADDLAQEVMAVVESSLESYKPSRGSFRSWLYQITRNLVVNHLTRCRGFVGTGDSQVARLLAQHPYQNDTATLFRLEYRRARFQQAVLIARTEFHEATWQAFWLTAVDHRSISSVAKELNKSEGAVRVARCRVLARLRAIVSEQSGGFEPVE